MQFLEFISNPTFIYVSSLLTVVLALLSCIFAYRSVKPKLKIFWLRNKNGMKFNAFIESPTAPRGRFRVKIENYSPNKTQIKNVSFLHKGKRFYCQNIYNKYPERQNFPDNFQVDSCDYLVNSKVPLTLDTFEIKEVCFIFPTFPNVSKYKFKKLIKFSVVGKFFPIYKLVTFTKIAEFEKLEPTTIDGKPCYVSVPNAYKVVSEDSER